MVLGDRVAVNDVFVAAAPAPAGHGPPLRLALVAQEFDQSHFVAAIASAHHVRKIAMIREPMT